MAGGGPSPDRSRSLFGVVPSTRLVDLLPRFLFLLQSSSSSRRDLDPEAMSSIWMVEELDSVDGSSIRGREVESGGEELDSGGDEQEPEFRRRDVFWLAGWKPFMLLSREGSSGDGQRPERSARVTLPGRVRFLG
jgi:hypothetical protein